jgi:hypothetical protein
MFLAFILILRQSLARFHAAERQAHPIRVCWNVEHTCDGS